MTAGILAAYYAKDSDRKVDRTGRDKADAAVSERSTAFSRLSSDNPASTQHTYASIKTSTTNKTQHGESAAIDVGSLRSRHGGLLLAMSLPSLHRVSYAYSNTEGAGVGISTRKPLNR